MVILWLLAGAAWGALAMLSLNWTVHSLRPRARGLSLLLLAGGLLLRLALAGGVLYLALRQSILAAGLTLAGMLITRSVLLVVYSNHEPAPDRPGLPTG